MAGCGASGVDGAAVRGQSVVAGCGMQIVKKGGMLRFPRFILLKECFQGGNANHDTRQYPHALEEVLRNLAGLSITYNPSCVQVW